MSDTSVPVLEVRNIAKQYPGVLMDLCFDDKGDIDRDSFLVEVKNGQQIVVETLPPLKKK